MKRMAIILTLFLFSSNCPALIIESELDANNIRNSEFNIEIEKKDQLIVFRVNWSKYTEHINNTQAFLQINNGVDTLVLTEVAINLFNRTQYNFVINKDLLKDSKFSIAVYHPTMPSGSIYWFNLKKMYDGLRAIEESKGIENGK